MEVKKEKNYKFNKERFSIAEHLFLIFRCLFFQWDIYNFSIIKVIMIIEKFFK